MLGRLHIFHERIGEYAVAMAFAEQAIVVAEEIGEPEALAVALSLSGISHHVSGYSGAVFVAYAGLAYTHGFSLYIWWAFTIGVTILASAKIFPVYWVRLRKRFQIQSPLEFLKNRYNLLTQQIIAWSSVILKLFDICIV